MAKYSRTFAPSCDSIEFAFGDEKRVVKLSDFNAETLKHATVYGLAQPLIDSFAGARVAAEKAGIGEN